MSSLSHPACEKRPGREKRKNNFERLSTHCEWFHDPWITHHLWYVQMCSQRRLSQSVWLPAEGSCPHDLAPFTAARGLIGQLYLRVQISWPLATSGCDLWLTIDWPSSDPMAWKQSCIRAHLAVWKASLAYAANTVTPVLLGDVWMDKWPRKGGLFLCQGRKSSDNSLRA